MKEWNELMDERGTRQRQADEAAGRRPRAQQAARATTPSSPPIPAPSPPGPRAISTMRGDMMFSCSGNLATMACGLPYAIAAAVAYPDRQVVAFVGDGGLTMLMGELATCVKYKLDVKIVVIKNNALGQIKWEQMVFLGNPEYVCELQPIDFAAVARGFGVDGVHHRRSGAVRRGAARRRLTRPGPALIEAVVDPHEPPMPPKATPSKSLISPNRSRAARRPRGKIALTVAVGHGPRNRLSDGKPCATGTAIDARRRRSAFRIPTDAPEADGTIAWDRTTLVLVEVEAGGNSGPRLHLCGSGRGRRHRRRRCADVLRAGRVRHPEACGPPWSARCAISAGAASRPARSPPSTSRCGT